MFFNDIYKCFCISIYIRDFKINPQQNNPFIRSIQFSLFFIVKLIFVCPENILRHCHFVGIINYLC